MRYHTGKIVVSKPQEAPYLPGAAWVVVLRASTRASVMAVQIAQAWRQRASQLVSIQAFHRRFDAKEIMLTPMLNRYERLRSRCGMDNKSQRMDTIKKRTCIHRLQERESRTVTKCVTKCRWELRRRLGPCAHTRARTHAYIHTQVSKVWQASGGAHSRGEGSS